jgi:4-hydroxy-2-oxoheptanedioate aldolase
MPPRINRAVELLAQGQPLYYVGDHTGHVLTYEQGCQDAATWADYINVGMEHGAFDMTGLAAYMQGLVDGGPTRSGHRTPTVIVEAPVEGVSAEFVRFNAWQFRQILARGVHGVLLCQAESADAVRAFVAACRYPVNRIGEGAGAERGYRGVGGEPTAMAIWGVDRDEYLRLADPWPLNPDGELLLGLKIESAAAIPYIEEILAVPGIGFAEMGHRDLSLSLGYRQLPRPYPPEMEAVRERVRAACLQHDIAFLEGATPEDVAAKIDAGARVIAGHREDTAQAGRAHTRRTMPT